MTIINAKLIHCFTVAAPILSAGTTTTTSISLSWTRAGSEDVSYEVMWETDDIGGCSGGSDMNSVTITNGSTSYDIMRLEENSNYIVVVISFNSIGSSAFSNNITAMTQVAGKIHDCQSMHMSCILCSTYRSSYSSQHYCHIHHHHYPVGASGLHPSQWRHNGLLSTCDEE